MPRLFLCLLLCTLLIIVAASASAQQFTGTVGVSVAPTTATVPLGGTQQFSAIVTGTTNQAVSWSTSGGTVSTSGLYTAPTSSGSGQVALDNVGPAYTGAAVTSGSTLSWNHTASGSNRLVMVGCSLGALGIPPFTLSVTYGGISMLSDPLKLKKVNGTGDGAVQMFYLVAPPTGLQPVSATLLGTTADLACGSVSFTGVDQSVALRNAATSTGFSSTPSISVSSAAGDMVINAIDYGCAGGSSQQTLAWMRETNCTTGGSNGAQSIAAGADTVATGYTIANDQWGMVAVDIVAAASGGPYTVTATSQADPTASATATVTISQPTAVAVSLSPTSASILANGTQQFTATVTGTTNQAVSWATSGGTVSASGLYTAPSGGGQVLLDAVGPGVAGIAVLGGSTLNWLHTASGSNRLVEVGCSVGKWIIPYFTLSATYGGISMIADPSLKTVNGTGDGAVQMFYLVAPPTGEQTVTVTLTGTMADLACGSVSFTGVNQSVALRNAATSTGYNTTPSITVNSAVGDLVVNAIDYGCSGGSSEQTLAWMMQLNCTTGGGNGAQSIAPGAASVTMGYTIANDEWGMVAVDIVAAESGQSGPYTVTATSQADPAKSATATVTIFQPTAVAVSLSPTSASIFANGTQQFTATVSGTIYTAVTWSATGGSISSTGLYTAPSTAGTYTVMATSAADITKNARVSVTVNALSSVTIIPNSVTTTTNGIVQFTASVSGSIYSPVVWSVAAGGGTISTSGLYFAPSTAGTASVVATSVADPRSSALADVIINEPGTVLLAAFPASVSFGSVLVGQSGSQTVNLTNTGNSSVTVSSASFTGSGFDVTGLTFPFTLAAAASKNASLTFTPSSSGTAWGSVSFVSNATNSPATVALSGLGTATAQHTATLSWQASGSDAIGFNVYRSTVSGQSYTRVNSTTNSIPNYADSTVQSGQTYYYVVTQLDSRGMESGYSSQVTAVIPTP